ncbi:GNAT family N-acetyltransferase [Kitasatospora sp. NPDC094019]|uniref:GNAT family N-acetyltransferase n=1 Tax=Kitasatospora sp. NPDC094019 TaxID=3364091 RepID=UPI00382DC67E
MDIQNPGRILVRVAEPSEWAAIAAVDSVAAAGDEARRAAVRRWCEQGLVLVAEGSSGPLGYGVLEYTFFEQGFVTMLMVADGARRRGVGALLLGAAGAACTAPKLFTSTNVSNLPMQRLLQREGWRAVGMLHGLDEDDPELFFRCPPPRTDPRTDPLGVTGPGSGSGVPGSGPGDA